MNSQKILFCFMFFLYAGCTFAVNKDSQKGVSEHLCHTDTAYTEYNTDVFVIRVYEPNNDQQPDIWQGPVCVINKKSGKECGFDLSLIKGVKIAKEKRHIEIGVFSGSNAKDYIVELETCEIRRKQ